MLLERKSKADLCLYKLIVCSSHDLITSAFLLLAFSISLGSIRESVGRSKLGQKLMQMLL